MVSAELICKVLCKLDLLVIDDIELQVIIAAPRDQALRQSLLVLYECGQTWM